MNRADKLLAAGLLILAIAAAAPLLYRMIRHSSVGKPLTAVITAQGSVRRSIDLSGTSEVYRFTETGRLGETTVEVSGRRIRISSAPCPDKRCIKHGWAKHAGEAIVCVPGEFIIQLTGDTAVDAVTR